MASDLPENEGADQRRSSPEPKPGDDGGGWGKGLSHGLEIIVGIGLGCLAGIWWDRHHQSGPWGMLVGIMLGFAAGMYLLLKDITRMNKD